MDSQRHHSAGQSQPDGLNPLNQLRLLLEREQQCLRALDLAGIDAVTGAKEALLTQLRGLKVNSEQTSEVKDLRELALRNQLLTVHTRDVVAELIGSVTGPELPGVDGNVRAVPRPGFRVSVRG